MTAKDKHYYLEEELLLVQNSGEIPEVAYHGSLYFLREDPEGPHLTLSGDDLAPLRQTVFDRYCRIILRDLNPALRKKSVYRGLARCIANWARLGQFCQRENLDQAESRPRIAKALLRFLQQEVADIKTGAAPSINCSAEALASFAAELGIRPEEMPEGWQRCCPQN